MTQTKMIMVGLDGSGVCVFAEFSVIVILKGYVHCLFSRSRLSGLFSVFTQQRSGATIEVIQE